MPAEKSKNGDNKVVTLKPAGSSKNEHDQAIVMFENILKSSPNDPFALEALYDAHLDKGDTKSAYKYLEKVADLVLNGNDADAMGRVADKLLFIGHDHPDAITKALELQEKISSLTSKSNNETVPKEPKRGLFADVKREISLAWGLMEDKQISKAEYTTITNELTEMSSDKTDIPVSVMQVLYDRGIGDIDEILAHISKKSNVPVVSLSNFELQMSTIKLLPPKFMKELGAIPFGNIGKDLMVAILNPFDKKLKEMTAEYSERACHFYLTSPLEYNNALTAILRIMRDAE